MGVLDAIRSLPELELPAASEEDVPLRLPEPDEEAPVPRAVEVEPLPAVAPPTPRLDEVPLFAP